MCADTSRGAAVRDLIAKALKGPLAPAQQQVLDFVIELCCGKMLYSLSQFSRHKHFGTSFNRNKRKVERIDGSGGQP